MNEYFDDLPEELEPEILEAYCVSCKEKVEIEEPVAVWTSKGRPGTRGSCSVCGGNVFRMGRTHLHEGSTAPKAVEIVPSGAKGRVALAAYIASAVTDGEFADGLGQDLKQIGINVWVDTGDQVDETQWAGGVHPALEQCTHLVVVLSSFTAQTGSIQEALDHFRSRRKPIIVVQVEENIDPPDDLRSRPRYDFTKDYKPAFRGLVEALSR